MANKNNYVKPIKTLKIMITDAKKRAAIIAELENDSDFCNANPFIWRIAKKEMPEEDLLIIVNRETTRADNLLINHLILRGLINERVAAILLGDKKIELTDYAERILIYSVINKTNSYEPLEAHIKAKKGAINHWNIFALAIALGKLPCHLLKVVEPSCRYQDMCHTIKLVGSKRVIAECFPPQVVKDETEE